MSSSITDSRYYLRSRSDKHHTHSLPTSSPISPSPTTPPMDIIPNPLITNTPINTRKRRPKNRRKRRFSQIQTVTNPNQDIDLNITSNTNKKAKLSRTIKFTLPKRQIKRIRLTFKNKHKHKHNQDLQPIISREASLSATSPILANIKAKKYTNKRIESYEIPMNNRMSSRNAYICCYSFFNGYTIGIKPTLGARNDLQSAIKILSQELVSGRAKASIQTQKNAYLVYIKTNKNKLIGCGILHIDHVWKRVNIEMFAIDIGYRGNGFASMMVYLIQYRMIYYNKYDLFVCAANDAVPFWLNKKYNFLYAHKGILEQHEVEDEKHAGTKHLIWYGTT
eukprot:909259_1